MTRIISAPPDETTVLAEIAARSGTDMLTVRRVISWLGAWEELPIVREGALKRLIPKPPSDEQAGIED